MHMGNDFTDCERKNIEIVKQVFSEIWSEKKVHLIPLLIDPGYIAHYDYDVITGLDRWVDEFYNKIVTSVPDIKVDIEDITAHNDTVVTRWRATGTQQVELFGIPPSDQTIGFSGISWTKLLNLKLIENWNSWSLRNFLQQLLFEVKELRELVPICCYCKKIRNDSGYWKQVESYLMKHLDISLSHGICPECFSKLELPE